MTEDRPEQGPLVGDNPDQQELTKDPDNTQKMDMTYDRVVYFLQGLQLGFEPLVFIQHEKMPVDLLDECDIQWAARYFDRPGDDPYDDDGQPDAQVHFVRGRVETKEPCKLPGVENRPNSSKKKEKKEDSIFSQQMLKQ